MIAGLWIHLSVVPRIGCVAATDDPLEPYRLIDADGGVVAPVAFHSLSSTHDAGLVVGGTLRVLHWIGLIGGMIFCLATAWLWLWAEVPAKVSFVIQLTLTLVMLAVTAYSQFSILPAMEVDRALAGGEVETASLENPGRVDFERLHRLSERLEGFVLACGLGVVFVLSRESRMGGDG